MNPSYVLMSGMEQGQASKRCWKSMPPHMALASTHANLTPPRLVMLCQPICSCIVGARRKGMYGPLASLLPRLGAQRLLSLRPDLVGSAIAAMEEQAICSAASDLVMAVLRQLRAELNTETGALSGAAWPTVSPRWHAESMRAALFMR